MLFQGRLDTDEIWRNSWECLVLLFKRREGYHEGGIFSSFKRSINTTRKIFTPLLRDDCESVIDDSRNSIAKRRLKFPFELSKFGEQKKTERSFLPPPFLSKFPFFFRDNEKGIL